MRKASAPFDGKPFDLPYIQSLISKRELKDKAFAVMDEVVRRERFLDEALRHIDSLKKKNSRDSNISRIENDYGFLKCRFRIMVAISRAAAAQKMASSAAGAYASQAMESAIDALRDAAVFGEKTSGHSSSLGAANPPVDNIKLFRSRLLAIWDDSQTRADMGPIVNMHLEAITKETLFSGSNKR